MITCKQCKWWGPMECGENPSYKDCNHPKVDGGDTDGFGCYDGEPYNGGSFATGPDFGCIHGEPQKPEWL